MEKHIELNIKSNNYTDEFTTRIFRKEDIVEVEDIHKNSEFSQSAITMSDGRRLRVKESYIEIRQMLD